MLIEGQYLNAKLFDKEEIAVRLNDNIESSINILLCKPELFEYKKNHPVF